MSPSHVHRHHPLFPRPSSSTGNVARPRALRVLHLPVLVFLLWRALPVMMMMFSAVDGVFAADCLGGTIVGGTTVIDLNTEATHLASLCTVTTNARYILDASTLTSPNVAGRYAVFATVSKSTFSGGSGLGLLLRQPGTTTTAASRLASAVIVDIRENAFSESALQISGTFPPGSRITVSNNTLFVSNYLCVLGSGYCSVTDQHTALHLFPALEVLANATVLITENTATISASVSSRFPVTVLLNDVFALEEGSAVVLRQNTLRSNAIGSSLNPHCTHVLCGITQLIPGRSRNGLVDVAGNSSGGSSSGGVFLMEENNCTVSSTSLVPFFQIGLHFACGDVRGGNRGVFAVRRNTVAVVSALPFMDVISFVTITLTGHATAMLEENIGSVSGGAASLGGATTRSSFIRSFGNIVLADDARLVLHRNTFRALTCPLNSCLVAIFLDVVVKDRAALAVTANTFDLPASQTYDWAVQNPLENHQKYLTKRREEKASPDGVSMGSGRRDFVPMANWEYGPRHGPPPPRADRPAALYGTSLAQQAKTDGLGGAQL